MSLQKVLEEMTKDPENQPFTTLVLKSAPVMQNGALSRKQEFGDDVYSLRAQVFDKAGAFVGELDTFFVAEDVSFLQQPVEARIVKPTNPLSRIQLPPNFGK